MGFGFLNVAYESVVTAYDDESTPLKLTGKKMLPIVVNNNERAQNESLDIIKSQDKNSILHWDKLSTYDSELNALLDKIGSLVHSLAMPYWIWTPEFNQASREYFQKKKEVKRGPFKELVKKQDAFALELSQLLNSQLLPELKNGFYKSETLTIMDIMVASHLWGLYVVPEFQFDPLIHEYLQRVKKLTQFDYHQDYWK
jgi:glutaredoxin 2